MRGRNSHGYGAVKVDGTQHYVHRLAYELFNGPIPEGMQVLHRCDVRCCCNPDHLFVGTIGDNMRDRTKKDRQAKGEGNGQAILTNEIVAEIRQSYADGGSSYQQLADKYGVSKPTVADIIKNRSWSHLNVPTT